MSKETRDNVRHHGQCPEKHAVYGDCIHPSGHSGEHRSDPYSRMTAWTVAQPPDPIPPRGAPTETTEPE